MNAIELAKDLESLGGPYGDVAAMLRKQAEAIRQLREALGEVAWSNDTQWQSDRAKAALAATEEFK